MCKLDSPVQQRQPQIIGNILKAEFAVFYCPVPPQSLSGKTGGEFGEIQRGHMNVAHPSTDRFVNIVENC